MAKKLAILHIVRSPVGGIFRHIADLATAQNEAGHAVGVICDSLTGGALEDSWIAALRPKVSLGIVRLPMHRSIGPADIPSILAVSRCVARMRPDVIHAHGSKGGVYGRLAAFRERRRGRQVAAFYAPHGGSLHYDPRSVTGRLYFAVERALEGLTDGLIHVSAYEAAAYRQKIGIPRCPAHVVLNGLKPEEFEPVVPEPDAVDFLFIGMLRDLKGVDVFLDALAELGREGRKFRALVVGAGEPADERRYHVMAEKRELAGKVTFQPPTPTLAVFPRTKAVVVPSRAESMPYLVLEVVAAGVPLVATNVGGIPEILEGESERLVTPGDPQALAAAMRRALDTPEDLRREAALRRERVKQKFSIAVMNAQVDGIYHRALEAYRERQAEVALPAGLPR